MNIPNFDASQVITKDGFYTPAWHVLFDQLLCAIKQYLSDEGVVVPSLSATDIAGLTNAKNFTFIGDATNNVLKVKINGNFVTVQTT